MQNIELLAILEIFENSRNYLKDRKNNFLVLTNYNNLYLFIDINHLSFY